ncbi:MAG: nitronate monooxygenase [Gammaproteobacteria bacterium]|nr:nitronate monooxygenase [Gammaproteobacteria bacterium]
MQNTFTALFNLKVPIVQGPMGNVAGPKLIAAVANAGGLAILPIWLDPIDVAVSNIQATMALTNKPFAVNIRADLVQRDLISAAIDTGVSIIHLFWGDPKNSISAMNDARMIATIGDRDAAQAALDSGAVALIAQGIEAGGHVLSEVPLEALLTQVLEVAGEVPVIAAGGCASAEDGAHLISLGAAGVLFGTRFAVCQESEAHEDYKQAIIEASENQTVRSLCFDLGWSDAPHRTLINSTTTLWDDAGQPPMGERPGEGDEVIRTATGQVLPRYSVMPPIHNTTGDIRAAAMYAGTGASKIVDCPTAAAIVEQFNIALG